MRNNSYRTLSEKWHKLRGIVLLHLSRNAEALALVGELTADIEELDPIMAVSRAIEDYRMGINIDDSTTGVLRVMELIVKKKSLSGSAKMSTVAKNVINLVSGNVEKYHTEDEDAQRVRLDGLINLLEIVRHSMTPWMPELCLTLRTMCDCGGHMDTGDIECPECHSVRFLCRATVEGCRAHSRSRMATPTNRMTTRANRYAMAMASDSRRAQSFLAMMTDENPLTTVPEINAIASRQEQLMEMLGGIGYAPRVAKAIDALSMKILGDLDESQEVDVVAGQIRMLVALIDQLRDDATIWREFKENSALMGKMIESQNKHAIAQQEMISRDQFRREKLAMIAAIREAVSAGASRYMGKLREALTIEHDIGEHELLSEDILTKTIGGEIVAQIKRLEMSVGMNDEP